MADTCPRCGFAEVASDKCPKCGVVIAVYQASLDKMRRGPQAGGSPLVRSSTPASTTPTPSAAPRPSPETPTPAAARPAPATTAARHAIFRGSGSSLPGIHVINALLILAAVFIPIAIVGARRYRLSRTSWRGIRFSLRASTRQFVGIWIRGWMLTSLTFGLYYPSFVTSQQRFLTSNTWFGSQRFAFDG